MKLVSLINDNHERTDAMCLDCFDDYKREGWAIEQSFSSKTQECFVCLKCDTPRELWRKFQCISCDNVQLAKVTDDVQTTELHCNSCKCQRSFVKKERS